MTTPDLALLARAGAELSVMFEITYGPQDNPEWFVEVNPEGSQLLIEMFDRLTAAKVPVPDEMAFLVSHLPKRF